MKVWVGCARGVRVAYFTLQHTSCTLVPPSTWAKRVPRVVIVPVQELRSDIREARFAGDTPGSDVRHTQTYVAHLGVWRHRQNGRTPWVWTS